MWKKEFTDTLKQTTLVLSFLLVIPIVFVINQMRFQEVELTLLWFFDWGLYYLIPALLFYLAYNMFASEDSDSATEYIQTLPVNKWKLLTTKILPRFLVILTLLVVYETFFSNIPTHIPWIRHFKTVVNLNEFRSYSFYYVVCALELMVDFLFWLAPPVLMVLISLINGFMLGISDRKNPILTIIAFIVPIIYLLKIRFYKITWIFVRAINPVESGQGVDGSIYVLSKCLALITTIIIPSVLIIRALIPIFKSWDCSSGKIRSQRILKRMLFPLGLLIALYTFTQFKLF